MRPLPIKAVRKSAAVEAAIARDKARREGKKVSTWRTPKIVDITELYRARTELEKQGWTPAQADAFLARPVPAPFTMDIVSMPPGAERWAKPPAPLRQRGALFEGFGNLEEGRRLADLANRIELAHKGVTRLTGKTIVDRIETVGAEPRIVTDLSHLREEYALLKCPGLASAFVSQIDQMPITDTDLKRRLAGHVVYVKNGKGESIPIPAFKAFADSSRKKVFYENRIHRQARA